MIKNRPKSLVEIYALDILTRNLFFLLRSIFIIDLYYILLYQKFRLQYGINVVIVTVLTNKKSNIKQIKTWALRDHLTLPFHHAVILPVPGLRIVSKLIE